ncbi:MAG TPA: carboxypeptidase-like regulatory domain-containing protein [Thermoanaerobaculia bacterium]
MFRARFALLLACLWLSSTAAFAAGIPIRGRVLDSSGAALAKTRVRLVPFAPVHAAGRLALEGKDSPEPVASAESAADGMFLLEAPEPGMWKVIAGGEGLVPQEIEAAPLTGELDLPSVRLQRDAGLTVRVLGPDGRPVPGARVRTEPAVFSSSSWQAAPRLSIADAEGRAVLPRAASAAVTVHAGASGFGTAERKEVRAKTVDLRLPTGPAVPLRVVGADGKPAAGVLVQWEEGGSLGMTGEDGRLDLVAPGGAPLDLLLIAADGRRLEARVRPLQAREPQAPRELRLPAAGETVARVASAADGRPLTGALVWRTDDPGSFRRTDARGEARLPAPSERDFAVQSAASGFLPEMVEVKKAQEKARRPLAFSLEPDLVVTGVVVDEAGSPVAGAEITSSMPNLPQGMPRLSRMQLYRSRGAVVRSGPDGRFRWGGLVAGLDFELRVKKPGFAPTRAQATSPSAERPAAPLRIVLRRGRSAFGRVLGPDQRPIAGAQVTLRTALPNDPRSRIRLSFEPESLDSFSAATGADGRFDLGNLPTGRYDLTVRGRGWAPLTVPSLEIPEGNRATDLGTVVLAPGVALEGFVVDAAGKPVEGAEIRLTDAGDPFPIRRRSGGDDEPAGLSGVDGSFRIEDLSAGSPVDVSASRTGYAPGEAQGIQVPADPPIRLVLQAVGTISGRVVDPNGKPIADAFVHVGFGPRAGRGMTMLSGGPQADRSDAEGNFRITDVIPGPVELSAQAPGWQRGTVAGLELRGGEEKSGIEIVLAPGAILKGRVLSPSGRPLPGAQVQTIFEDLAAGTAMKNTDDEGRYELDTLAPGNRTLEASHPDYGMARRQVELRPGENSLDFTLEGGNEVTGRVVDDAGRPVAGAQVTMIAHGVFQRFQDTSEADGSFRFAAVADGAYEAFASKEGFAPPERAQVTVAGSSVGGIELRLSQGGAIVGRIAGLEASELLRVQVSARGSGRGLGTVGRIEPDGSYRIDHLREGEWRVQAELPGTSLYAEGVARLEPGASETRLDLEMQRGLELSGRVRRNGAPVAGEFLFLDGSQRKTGQTDSDGRFRFQGLAAGSYRLRVGGRSDGPEHEEAVDLQADREITIDLSTAELSGRVVDAADGSPLANANVQLLPADSGSAKGEARTDSRGIFVLRGVAEGSWRLRALADGYAPGEVDIRVDRSSPADGVELSLRATEGVTLQVTTTTGAPPRSLFYVAMDGAGRKVADGTAAVADDGRARLSRVPPGGWQVLLLTTATGAIEIAVTAPGDAGRITLPPPCVLRVKVRALADSPAPASMSLIGAGGRPFRTFVRMGEPTATWDVSRGAVTLSEVPPGTWEVQVTAADGRTWRATVTTTPGVEAEAVME